MPRYYFDVKNGHRLIDPAGLDCDSPAAAKKKGRHIASQIASDCPTSKARKISVLDWDRKEIEVIPIHEPDNNSGE
jgi:hypothetical protein